MVCLKNQIFGVCVCVWRVFVYLPWAERIILWKFIVFYVCLVIIDKLRDAEFAIFFLCALKIIILCLLLSLCLIRTDWARSVVCLFGLLNGEHWNNYRLCAYWLFCLATTDTIRYVLNFCCVWEGPYFLVVCCVCLNNLCLLLALCAWLQLVILGHWVWCLLCLFDI